MSQRQFFAVMMMLLAIATQQLNHPLAAALIGTAASVAAIVEFGMWIAQSSSAKSEKEK